jgi:nitrogen fixation-related uncharacterized protein
MVVSVFLALRPLAAAVHITPSDSFVGDLTKGGLKNCIFLTVALLIAIPVSLFLIVLAWIAYRPYIAVPILAVYFVLIVCLCMRARKAKQDDDDDDDNNNGSREDLKLEPNPFSSSNHSKAQFVYASSVDRWDGQTRQC